MSNLSLWCAVFSKVRNLPVILQFYFTVIYRNLPLVTGNVTGALNPTLYG